MLSDEQIDTIAESRKAILLGGKPYFPWFDFARAVEAAVLEELAKQEPVAWWCERYFDDEEEAQNYCDTKAQIAESITPLYAAPVVQPDMVMVPMEPTEAMLDAAMNRYKHVSPEAKARYTQMHRENFRCDYKAMIAAAEGKSNAGNERTPD